MSSVPTLLVQPTAPSRAEPRTSPLRRRELKPIAELDPLTDPRWPEFVAAHPHSSVFHTRAWLRVLQATYGYRPVVFGVNAGKELIAAVLFCEIRSAITGRRLVSLPFSDHCEPLADAETLDQILRHVGALRSIRGWRYIELRPATPCRLPPAAHVPSPSERFALHTIDLRPPLEEIYSGLHHSCIRRKIKKAEKEELAYEAGRSEDLLRKFRHLLLLTRRRHQLPPQPTSWFSNIVRFLGPDVTIHLLSKGDTPVSSILTLRHREVLTYKYGCSDFAYSNLGGTPLIFWKAIQSAKSDGIRSFDLGRSCFDDPGLIAFKDHLGATASEVVYLRTPAVSPQTTTLPPRAKALAQQALIRLPDPLFSGVGRLLYRHIG